MINFIKTVFVLSLFCSNFAFSQNSDTSKYNDVLDKYISVYQKIIYHHFNKGLSAVIEWDNEKEFAIHGLDDSNENYEVIVSGGFVNHPQMDKDTLTVLFCHEIGHLLAGYHYVFPTASLSSSQGQANYYAAQVCMKKMFVGQDKENRRAEKNIAKYPKSLCDKAYENINDRRICYRTLIASKELLEVSISIDERYGKPNEKIDFNTPDTLIVAESDISGGSRQCQLDTFLAGALCNATWNDNLIPGNNNDSASETLSSTVTCTRSNLQVIGARPLCWFKPLI